MIHETPPVTRNACPRASWLTCLIPALAVVVLGAAGLGAQTAETREDLNEQLALAVREDNADGVLALIAKGADPNGKNKFDMPPLSLAALHGRIAVMDALLSKGAQLEGRSMSAFAKGLTALMHAEQRDTLAAAEFLLSKGANPNATDDVGRSALFRAVVSRKIANVKFLLSKGADPNLSAPGGWTPLMQADGPDQHEMVRLLLANGADPTAVSDEGVTVMARAKNRGDTAMVRIYEAAIAKGRPPGPAAAAMAPAAGLSKEEMQRMMAEAVKQAAQAAQPRREDANPKSPTIVSEVDKPNYRGPEQAGNFAVLIGIDRYSGSLPAAQFAERDAQAVRAHLLALGYPPRNIRHLSGSEATRGGIVKNIESWLPRVVGQDSTVFIYFSGHGAPDVRTGQAYLVSWDGDPEFLEDTAYPVKRLYQKLGALKAKRVIVALDSCFSGAGGRSVLAKGARPLVTNVDTGVVPPKKIVVLTASQADQISGTIEEQGHGAFTYYLLNGLNGGAVDASGHVTIKNLFDYILPKVRDEASRHNRDQTPQLILEGPPESASFGLK